MPTMDTDLGPVRAAWERDGYSCDLWVDPPGREWRDFVHAADERVRVLEGTIELTARGRTERLGPGDEAFIPARHPHTVRNVGGTTARWLYGYRVAPA
jgi:mannose-6-phosphate isomerase-like protein (cupin superfamily)